MRIYLISILILIFIFTTISFAEPIVIELGSNPGIGIDSDSIKIIPNDDGSLQAVTYIISSTRLNKNSTTTYQTSEIHIKLGNKTYKVKTDALKKDIKPKAGQGKVWHQVTVTAQDIIDSLSKKMDNDQLNYYIQNPEKIEVGAKIDIIQNGESMASIEDEEDIEIVAGHYHFTDKHFADMHSRFKSNDPIIPKKKETPKTGLRPTIIIDESKHNY